VRTYLSFFVALPVGFFLCVAFFVILLNHELGVPTYTSAWAKYLYDRKEALAAHIHQPKLLLVGGSATLFGLNAGTIQAETGVPTVNFGTHAGLQAIYILHRVELTARPGDTVLLVLEYGIYSLASHVVGDDYILARDPSYFRQLSWLEKLEMAERVPWKRLREKPMAPLVPIVPKDVTPFSVGPETIDDHGDEMYNVKVQDPAAKAKNIRDGTITPLPNGGFFSGEPPGLVEFLRWARNHQVRVLATFPQSVYKPQYDGPEFRLACQQVENFYAGHGVPVLGTPQEALLPEVEFYNDIYHLLHGPAIERTKRLVPYLMPYMSSGRITK
jgi:hypothetical protein